MSLSSRDVPLNGNVELRYTFLGAAPEAFIPPVFSGLQVESGPVSSIQYATVEGRLQRQLSYVYWLRPLKSGTIIIPPAGVRLAEERFYSDTIRLRVTRALDMKPGLTAQASLLASHADAWVGQQLSLELQTLLADTSWHVQHRKTPDFEGFASAGPGHVVDSRYYARGRSYRFFREYFALYPMRSGRVNIGVPELELMAWKKDDFSPFMHLTRLMALPVDSLSMVIRPLPAPVPAQFSGGVGHYRMEASLDKASGSTAEMFTLRLLLRGDGDPQRTSPPVLDLPDGLLGQAPRRIAERELPGSTGLRQVEQTYEYLITAERAGQYRFSPAFSYFDTDSLQYQRLLGDTLSLNIHLAAVERAIPKPGSGSQPMSGWWWALLLIPMLVLLRTVFIRRKAEPLPAQDSRLDIRYALSGAAAHMAAGRERLFYEALSRVLLDELGTLLALPVGARTSARLERAFEERQVPEEIRDKVSEVLREAEAVKYAGAIPPGQMSLRYQQSVQVLAWFAVWNPSEQSTAQTDRHQDEE